MDKLQELRMKLWCDVYVAATAMTEHGAVVDRAGLADAAVENFDAAFPGYELTPNQPGDHGTP